LAREPQASVFRHGCQIRPSPRSASEPDRPDATLLNSLTWPYFIARQPRPTNCSQKKAWLKPKATLTKGTNGRYNPAPHGDRFRNLITRREPAGFTEKSHSGVEGARGDGTLARPWSWRRWTSQGNPDESWPFRFPPVYGVADVIKSEIRYDQTVCVSGSNYESD